MKREIRRDARVYKENKAKLRKMKEQHLKRKLESKDGSQSSNDSVPTRKVRKLTEGLPQGLKSGDMDIERVRSGAHTMPLSIPSSRHNDTFESKRTKLSAFVPVSTNTLPSTTSSMNSSFTSTDSTTRTPQNPRPSIPANSLTQSIVSKLPSIGHKFVGDTEKLIMKNTIKPILSAELTSPVAMGSASWIASNHAQHQLDKADPHEQAELKQHDLQEQQDHQQLSSKKSNMIATSSSMKPYVRMVPVGQAIVLLLFGSFHINWSFVCCAFSDHRSQS